MDEDYEVECQNCGQGIDPYEDWVNVMEMEDQFVCDECVWLIE